MPTYRCPKCPESQLTADFQLRMRFYEDGSPEPEDWDITQADFARDCEVHCSECLHVGPLEEFTHES